MASTSLGAQQPITQGEERLSDRTAGHSSRVDGLAAGGDPGSWVTRGPLVAVPTLGQFWLCPHPSGDADTPGAPVLSVTGHPSGPVIHCRGLPTDRYMWSDASGLQECTKAGTKPPSLQWTWVSSGLRDGG